MLKRKIVKGFENPEVIKEIIIHDREKVSVRGGYMIRTQIMSDDIPDDVSMDKFVTVYHHEIEKYLQKYPSSNKTELIQKWRARINKMRQQIKEISEDSALTVDEKKHKIARRLEIIKNDQQSIAQALNYLKHRNDAVKDLISKQEKTK